MNIWMQTTQCKVLYATWPSHSRLQTIYQAVSVHESNPSTRHGSPAIRLQFEQAMLSTTWAKTPELDLC